jgi:uncharacterized flavoprotein (TIGR03862 family)
VVSAVAAPDRQRLRVAVIGAGPAGLMAADVLAAGGAGVTIYDRMPSAGRKFLLAGRGGLNLTHSEDLEQFLARYRSAAARLRAPIEALPPSAVRAWCERLGEPTFVGSSGRVFPRSFKASPLLRAWLRHLDAAGVRFVPRHRWTGWDGEGRSVLIGPDGQTTIQADAVVLAFGGASWPRLGSDGAWADIMGQAGIAVAPLRPANCGVLVAWSELFRSRFAGHPLKRIALSYGSEVARGEAIVTQSGLEGGSVYALSAPLREAIVAHGAAVLHFALRPDVDAAALERKLSAPRGKESLATFLRKVLRLAPVEIGLLHEAALSSGAKLSDMSATTLAHLVNDIPIRLTGTAPIERAISTAGGVSFAEVDENLMLRRRPGTFVAGEMLDWEAPTGGYLLQASFATGAAAGRGVLRWLDLQTR